MSRSDADTPAISAVVPCRNEMAAINETVESLLRQEKPPGGFEILLCDGMSDDGTRQILTRVASEFPTLRLVDNPKLITPAGMNAGIRESRGRYIAIMGSHNRYAEDYLASAVRFLDSHPEIDNVGGSMFFEANGWVERAISIAFKNRLASGGARWHDPEWDGPADTVFGGVYRREVFDRIGLFDETLVRNQDDELNLRLTRAGGKIWQSPTLKSWYRPRSTFGALFKQYEQYGYWRVRVIQKHRIPASGRQLAPGAFVAATLLLLILVPFSHTIEIIALAAGMIYFTVLLAAAVCSSSQSRWDVVPLLPIVFACLHFGYGIGFLRGIFDFMIMRRGPGARYVRITRRANN